MWYTTGSSWPLVEAMAEPFDEFSDQFNFQISAYGVALNFQRSDPKPSAVGSQPRSTDVGTIRMSSEHLKVMTYLFWRQVKEAEANLGISIQVPIQVLNGLHVAPEDWEAFWRHDRA